MNENSNKENYCMDDAFIRNDIHNIFRDGTGSMMPEHYIQEDPVNHPSHYTRGNIEVADFIEDQGLNENAWLAMAIKYICRAGHKDPDKYTEDLRKAIWYLNREVKRIENKK